MTINVLTDQKKILKKHLNDADKINTKSSVQNAIKNTDYVKTGTQNLYLDNILFIETDRNYFRIYLANETQNTFRFIL